MWSMAGERHKPFTQVFVACLNFLFSSPNICDAHTQGTIRLFNKCFLNTYYKPGPVPETEDTAMNNTDDGALIVSEIS